MPIPAIAAIAGRSLASEGAGSLLKAGIGGANFGKSTAEGLAKMAGNAKSAAKETENVSSAFDHFRYSARRATLDFYIAKAALAGLSGRAISLLTAPLDIMVDLAKPIQNLVALTNPAIAERFTIIMRDAYAVIGQMLTPAMQVMNQLMRRLGDAFAKLQPVLQPTIDYFTRLADKIGNQLISSLEKSGPMIAGIAQSFELLTSSMIPLETTIKGLTFLLSANFLPNLLGAASKRQADPNRSSVGLAVRNVQIGTSAEDISKQAQAKAFSSAVNEPGKKTQEDVPGILDQILTFIKDNLSLDKLKDAISSLIPNAKNIPGGETIKEVSEAGIGPGGQLARWLASMRTR